VFRRPDGVRSVVQLELVCLRPPRDVRGRYCSTICTTFSLQLSGDHESEHVWRPFKLRQCYGEVQPQFPVFQVW
jgi:hypothetical protein